MIIAVLLALLGGGLAGTGLALYAGWRWVTRRRPAHLDYRERWLAAVKLLGEEGRLTEDQARSLELHGTLPAPPAPVAPAAPAAREILASLRGMASWDRRALEVNRAIRGLPPVDDLRGMASWDKKTVIEARIKHGTAR